MLQKVVLFWFRRDLRLDDNAGLFHALSSGYPVIPIFIFDSDMLSQLEDKDDKRVSFIHTALQKIQQELQEVGATMDVRFGKPLSVLQQLLNDYDVNAVYTNHDYEPYAKERDEKIQAFLTANGISFYTFKDQVIFEKDEVSKDDGGGYMVYTPYAKRWRALLNQMHYRPFESHKLFSSFYKQQPLPLPGLKEMGFVYNSTIPSIETVDETIVKHYDKTRDIPAIQGTTRMGIHLRFGTVSVRKLAAKALSLNNVYLSELIWREFFMQILWRHPRVVNEACKKEYDNIKWRNNEDEFERWCEGKTGYPIVDAGMRELNATGFMHNRVRMIVGSFLVKDLLVDWRWGEAYFARKLMDFELASNNGNWQWVAGCGCDAAPYFRVFNPTIQAKKFDPQGLYIKKWIPELESFSYPRPIVEHDYAKQRCLAAYKAALPRRELFANK
jgi:deoxyribodipyrimidine photo-lyase